INNRSMYRFLPSWLHLVVLCAALSLVTSLFGQTTSDTIAAVEPAPVLPASILPGAALPDAPAPATEELKGLPLDQQPHPEVTLRSMPKHFTFDAIHIFASPAYLRTRDLKWLVPLS